MWQTIVGLHPDWDGQQFMLPNFERDLPPLLLSSLCAGTFHGTKPSKDGAGSVFPCRSQIEMTALQLRETTYVRELFARADDQNIAGLGGGSVCDKASASGDDNSSERDDSSDESWHPVPEAAFKRQRRTGPNEDRGIEGEPGEEEEEEGEEEVEERKEGEEGVEGEEGEEGAEGEEGEEGVGEETDRETATQEGQLRFNNRFRGINDWL